MKKLLYACKSNPLVFLNIMMKKKKKSELPDVPERDF